MAPLFLLNGDIEIDDAADENELMAQAPDMTDCVQVMQTTDAIVRHPVGQRVGI